MIHGDAELHAVDDDVRLAYLLTVGLAHGLGWPDVLDVPMAYLEYLDAYSTPIR